MENLLLESSINNMLTDSIGIYKQKYAKYVDNAEKANFESTGRKLSTNLTSTLVKNLKATEDFLGERGYLKEETTPSDINAFIHHAFDMISAIIPGNVIEEFATIQGMEKRVGEIFFMDIIKANSKAPATLGDNYLSSQYGPNTGQNYSDERVLGEVIASSDNTTFTGTVTWNPVKSAGADPLFVDCLTGLVSVRAKFYFTYGGDNYVGDITSANAVGAYVQNTSTLVNTAIAGIVTSAVIATSTAISFITPAMTASRSSASISLPCCLLSIAAVSSNHFVFKALRLAVMISDVTLMSTSGRPTPVVPTLVL